MTRACAQREVIMISRESDHPTYLGLIICKLSGNGGQLEADEASGGDET